MSAIQQVLLAGKSNYVATYMIIGGRGLGGAKGGGFNMPGGGGGAGEMLEGTFWLVPGVNYPVTINGDGLSSVMNSVTANGGGKGGDHDQGGSNGGSGGGGGGPWGAGGTGTGSGGFDGGTADDFYAGGGGGAGGAGGKPTGGIGRSSSITGTPVTYGIGGQGGSGYQDGSPATMCGMVIFRVPTVNYSGNYTGTPTITTDGADTVVKFTASGSYTA